MRRQVVQHLTGQLYRFDAAFNPDMRVPFEIYNQGFFLGYLRVVDDQAGLQRTGRIDRNQIA